MAREAIRHSAGAGALGWVLMSEPYEIMPFNDVHNHRGELECECGAYLNEDDIITHNAVDGREDYQLGRRKPH